jgi:hypothetical protein
MLVRIRVLVDGVVVEDNPVRVGGASRALIGELGAQHGEIAARAEAAGLPYLIEIEFPDGQRIRWGTDTAPMIRPMPVRMDELLDVAHDLIDRFEDPESEGGET